MPRQVLEDTLTADSIAADSALAASGDATAFERLYRTHVARVHTLVRRMLDADEADDVTQDVFIRAWQKLSTFRGESAFGTWLHRLAVNVVLARRNRSCITRGWRCGGTWTDERSVDKPAFRVHRRRARLDRAREPRGTSRDLRAVLRHTRRAAPSGPPREVSGRRAARDRPLD